MHLLRSAAKFSGWKLALAGLTTATLVSVAGCSGGSSSSDGESAQTFDSLALFDPVPTIAGESAIIPFPFNGLYAGFNKPTLNIPNAAGSATFALVDSVNHLDGFSTVADLFADVLGTLDYTTVGPNVLIYDTSTGKPLVFGTDFTVQNSNATAVDAGTGQTTPISSQRSRILIEPTHPLKPGTSYLVALKNGMRNSQGGGLIPSDIFKVTSSSTPVAQQTAPVLALYSDAQKATLESLRSTLIQPAVAGISQLSGVPSGDLVLAWSFTTQSLGKTLGVLAANATATTIAVQNTGVTTATAVGVDGATIYAGIVSVPYYLKNSGGNPQSSAPLTQFWKADATKPDVNASFPIGPVPCGAFATGATINGQTAAPSESTTVCYPVPVKNSDEVIPLLVAVPNAASGRSMPAAGWPIVIFQHGITGNRTQMLAIAPALAKAGFVTVAIDLPLHGLTDKTSPFYRNQLFAGSPAAGLVTGERTFDLDLENNSTSAPGPDGVIDSSGTYFINLSSLLTARDNLRQAETDLVTLTKSVANLRLSTDGSVKVDPTQIRFAGISLGSIVGVPYLANVGGTAVGAATLAVPGGGIAKLLDASKTFGPIVAAGLSAAGVKEGSDDYETFLRFAQTVTDDGDPLNYAAAAVGAHPIHLIEVIGDTVVPNASPASAGSASEDLVTVGSNLGGTDPLIAAMGLSVLGPIDVPVATASKTINTAGVRAAVKFKQGSHGSLLDPTASPAATVEMQTETANFLGSNGICLPVGGGC